MILITTEITSPGRVQFIVFWTLLGRVWVDFCLAGPCCGCMRAQVGAAGPAGAAGRSEALVPSSQLWFLRVHRAA